LQSYDRTNEEATSIIRHLIILQSGVSKIIIPERKSVKMGCIYYLFRHFQDGEDPMRHFEAELHVAVFPPAPKKWGSRANLRGHILTIAPAMAYSDFYLYNLAPQNRN
jgi:hypothetical protein